MENNHKGAGIDIAVGFASDSFFEGGKFVDPWKKKSLEDLIDLIINYDSTVFPSPTRLAIENIDDSRILPKTFVKGIELKLIKPYAKKPADEISLSEKDLIEQYNLFKIWTRKNHLYFKQWLNFHLETPYIRDRQKEIVPTYIVDIFLRKENRLNLANELKIQKESLSYAFDVWYRTLNYYKLFGSNKRGSIFYFPHEFRRTAIYNNASPIKQPEKLENQLESIEMYQGMWSWGKCFVSIMNETPKEYKTLDWLMEHVLNVKEATKEHNATWDALELEPPSDRVKILENIALDSGLPITLKEETLSKIKETYKYLSFSATMGSSLFPPYGHVIAILLQASSISVDSWKGKIKGPITRLPILKGQIKRHIRWPYISDLQEK